MATWHPNNNPPSSNPPSSNPKHLAKSVDNVSLQSLHIGSNSSEGSSRAFDRRASTAGVSSANVARVPVNFKGPATSLFQRSISDKGKSSLDPRHVRHISADDADEGDFLSVPIPFGLRATVGQSYSSLGSSSSGLHSTGSSADLSSFPSSLSVGDTEEGMFSRAEFGKELDDIVQAPCPEGYLYLRRLLIRVLLDPKLAGLRERLVKVSGTSEEICELKALINKVRGWTIPKKPEDAKVEMKKLEKTILSDIEESFPTYNVLDPVTKHVWTTEAMQKRDILCINTDAMAEKTKQLGIMLGTLSSDCGLVSGEISDPAAHYRPVLAVPPCISEGHDEAYYVPVEFVFVLDGKAMKLPISNFKDIAERKFIRLLQAKQNAIASEAYWKSMHLNDQKLVAGEAFNDDFTMCSDTQRFDCKFVKAFGEQLPPAAVFSSREFRSACNEKNKTDDSGVATSQMFMEALSQFGGFNSLEQQFVAGIFSQGSVNEIFNYCSGYYFPEREFAFSSPTVSEQLQSDPASLARMEVIDWGGGCLELVCEFKYDRYSISPNDKTKFRAETKAVVRAVAHSTKSKVSLSKISINIQVDRKFSAIEKLSMMVKRKSAVQENKRRAEAHKEDTSRDRMDSQRYVERTYREQYGKIADSIVKDRGMVGTLLSSQVERDAVLRLLDNDYDSSAQKVRAVKDQLKTCDSLNKPRLGITRPLPPWLLELKQGSDESGVNSCLDRSDSRLISTQDHGWVATNISEVVTQPYEYETPRMKHAISRDNLLDSKTASESSSSCAGGIITPRLSKEDRFSVRVAEHQQGMRGIKLRPMALSKLITYFKLTPPAKENEVMARIQDEISSKTDQPDWENSLMNVLDKADLVEQEKISAVKYTKKYFKTMPGFTCQKFGSVPVPLLVTTGVESSQGSRRLKRRVSEQPSQATGAKGLGFGMTGTSSHPNLPDGDLPLSPLKELPIPVPSSKLIFTFAESDYDHLSTLELAFADKLKTLETPELRRTVIRQYQQESEEKASALALRENALGKFELLMQRRDDLIKFLSEAKVDLAESESLLQEYDRNMDAGSGTMV